MPDKVLVTNRIHPEVVAFLAEHARVDVNPYPGPWPRAELLRRARDAAAIMAFMNDRIDRPFLDACRELRIVACALKGYDNFDVAACTERGIWVTVVPDLLTAPTAELAIGLLIALGRNVLPADRFVRSGAFRGWRPTFYGTGLAGSTVGIIGMGAVGRAIALRLRGFEARVLYADPRPLPDPVERELGIARAGFDAVLASADFVVLAVPLGPATFHLINAGALRRMKPGAFLVNPARGSVVDEAAVAEMLAAGRLGGYAADAFATEDWARVDRPAGIPETLLVESERTLFTPHLGSAVARVRREIEMQAARQIVQALAGERPEGAVNRPAPAREPLVA